MTHPACCRSHDNVLKIEYHLIKMATWSVVLVSEAEAELEEAPPQIRNKFDHWVVAVQALGPWLKGGCHSDCRPRLQKRGKEVDRHESKCRTAF